MAKMKRRKPARPLWIDRLYRRRLQRAMCQFASVELPALYAIRDRHQADYRLNITLG